MNPSSPSVEAFVRELCEPAAERAGVAAWSVWGSEGISVSLPTKDGQTGNAHAPLAATDGCLIRYKLIWDDGTVSRGSVDRFGVEARPREILAQARREAIDDADSAYVLAPAALPDVALFDVATARVAAGDVAPWSRRLARIREAVRAANFRTWSASFRASSSETRLLNSRGFDASAPATSTSWWVSFDGEHGDGESSRAAESDADFVARVDRCAEIAALLRVPATGETAGMRTVLLHPKVVSGLFLDTLLHHLDGKTVAKHEGWFHEHQFGHPEAVVRGDVTLRLDPLVALETGSYRFTQDGVPAARCDFIRDGRLVTPVASLKYARVLGLPPTPLPHGTDGMYLEAGRRLTLPEAYEAAAGGALILDVLGLHTLDTASGDFSLSAPQVLALGAAGPRGRFRATVSGNLLELLRSATFRLVEFPGERHPGALIRCRLDPR